MLFDFRKRKPLLRSQISNGDVVAFEYCYDDEKESKKGVALMESGDYFYGAYNLYKEEGRIWISDSMPSEYDGLYMYEPTKEEYFLAIKVMGDIFMSEGLDEPMLPGGKTATEIKAGYVDYCEVQRQFKEYLKTELSYAKNKCDESSSKYYDATREIDELKARIKVLESANDPKADKDARIRDLETELEVLRKQPTADDLMKTIVAEVKNHFKHIPRKADDFRQIFRAIGRYDAESEIDSWMEGRENPNVKAIQKQTEMLRKNLEKPRVQNIYGDKNEFKEEAKMLKLTLPANADPAEIAMRIAEQQKQIEKKNDK